jgi:NTE family protein
MLTRMLSPYQFNPMNYNPLRYILEQSVDFERLRAGSDIKLFLSATNVRSGKVRIFKTDEVTPDAVLASACLPFMFQAVEIDGEHYWDGGYMGIRRFSADLRRRTPDVVVAGQPLAATAYRRRRKS